MDTFANFWLLSRTKDSSELYLVVFQKYDNVPTSWQMEWSYLNETFNKVNCIPQCFCFTNLIWDQFEETKGCVPWKDLLCIVCTRNIEKRAWNKCHHWWMILADVLKFWSQLTWSRPDISTGQMKNTAFETSKFLCLARNKLRILGKAALWFASERVMKKNQSFIWFSNKWLQVIVGESCANYRTQ